MGRAIELARGVEGCTSPNPPVGAVIVAGGRTVGEGATQRPGDAHAEIIALRQAGDRARGATLYVTLEPCSHQGRTPPCADAIIAAGITEVYVAVEDPNPLVNGRGLARLQGAGIRTALGEGETEARELIAGHTALVTRGRPLVTAVVGSPFPDSVWLAHGVDAIWEDRGVRLRSGEYLSDFNVDSEYHVVLHDLAAHGIARLVVTQQAAARALIDAGLADRIIVPEHAAPLADYPRRLAEHPAGHMTYERRPTE